MGTQLKWRALSLMLRTIGRTSNGVSLGYRYGFDSGEMLDYVYENRARGKLLIGKAIDRQYLNAIGWRAIRERKELLKEVLLQEVASGGASGQEMCILDAASGPGRYLIEMCQQLKASHPEISMPTVICRDLDTSGLQWGREKASRAGLTNIRYEPGDACDPASLAAVRPRPQIVVVSGLYELFTDTALIRRSMAGIYSILEPGGRLIFSTQVYHPQLEMIANVLVNREGKPWIMTCRPVETTEKLAADTGFAILGSRLEPLGLFALTTAKKPGSKL